MQILLLSRAYEHGASKYTHFSQYIQKQPTEKFYSVFKRPQRLQNYLNIIFVDFKQVSIN